MITQKGLKDEDIVVIMNAEQTEATFNVSFPDCDKFAEFKRYASAEECNAKFQEDFQAYKNSLASTVFTVSMDEEDEENNEVAINDSWGSIFNDALSSVKTKLFR
jgi:hypothetical protein